MKNNKICVLGFGLYWFSNCNRLFANNKYDVYGVEKNEKILKNLDSGIIHIDEPNLNEMALHAIKNKNLRYGTFLKADIFLICVPTPIQY